MEMTHPMPRGVGRNFSRGVVLNVNLMVLFALVSALTLYAGNVKHLPPKRAGRTLSYAPDAPVSLQSFHYSFILFIYIKA